MLTGLLTLSTGEACLAILFTFRDHWCLALLWSRNILHCHLLKLSYTRCPMLLRKRFGSILYLVFCISKYPDLSLVIIKWPVLFWIFRLFQLVWNISIFTIIFFMIMFRPALSLLFGYQQKICQQIFLQKPFLLLFFSYHCDDLSLSIPSSWLFTYFSLFSSFIFSPSVLMGVCWP